MRLAVAIVMRQATPVPKVLIVDDDPAMREAVERALEAVALVAAARDAVQALQLLRMRHFDVVLSDYVMPGMDGVTFLRCAAHLAPDCRRFLVSGQPPEGIPDLVANHVIHGCLEKPWSLSQLLATLEVAPAPVPAPT